MRCPIRWDEAYGRYGMTASSLDDLWTTFWGLRIPSPVDVTSDKLGQMIAEVEGCVEYLFSAEVQVL
jgi:hypothetical protein